MNFAFREFPAITENSFTNKISINPVMIDLTDISWYTPTEQHTTEVQMITGAVFELDIDFEEFKGIHLTYNLLMN